MEQRTCLYTILGVERDADEKTISKAYKKAALKWHPDRNYGNEEEATKQFKLVQEAHETLMDKHERAWYDSHRSQILRGLHQSEMDSTAVKTDHLFAFFSTRCYRGMDGEDGFFMVYSRVFSEIDSEEGKRVAPLFGKADSPWSEVRAFYSHFTSFSSKRDFSGADKWKLSNGENRKIRRLMEKDNKKIRKEQRQTYNSLIRRLASWVKRRDPRVLQRNLEVARRKERQAEEKRARELEKQRQLQEAREKHRQEMEKLRETNPELFESSSEEVEVIQELFECICCDKRFKSENALESHNRSKKHKVNYKKMLKKLQDEEFMAGIGASGFNPQDLLVPETKAVINDGARRGKKKKKKKWKQTQQEVKDDCPEDTKSSDLASNEPDARSPLGNYTDETSENPSNEKLWARTPESKEKNRENQFPSNLESSSEPKESSGKEPKKSTSNQESPCLPEEFPRKDSQDIEKDSISPSKEESPSKLNESPEKDSQVGDREQHSSKKENPLETSLDGGIPDSKTDHPIVERMEDIEITEEHGKKKKRRRRRKDKKKNKPEKLDPFQCLYCKVQFDSKNQVMKHLKSKPEHALPYLKLQQEQFGEELDRQPRQKGRKKKKKR